MRLVIGDAGRVDARISGGNGGGEVVTCELEACDKEGGRVFSLSGVLVVGFCTMEVRGCRLVNTEEWRGGGLGMGAVRTGEVVTLLTDTFSGVSMALDASDFVSTVEGLLSLPAKAKGSGIQDLRCLYPSKEDIGDILAGAAVALS